MSFTEDNRVARYLVIAVLWGFSIGRLLGHAGTAFSNVVSFAFALGGLALFLWFARRGRKAYEATIRTAERA